MEEPVFYQSRPNGKPISARQRQTLLQKIDRLEREAALLQTHALQLTRYAKQLRIGAPDFATLPLSHWKSFLCGLKKSRL